MKALHLAAVLSLFESLAAVGDLGGGDDRLCVLCHLLFRPVFPSVNFIAEAMTPTKVDVVGHGHPGPCSVLDDGRAAVAEEVDRRSCVDLAREVLERGVPGTLRVDAEHQESFAEGLMVDVLAGSETGKQPVGSGVCGLLVAPARDVFPEQMTMT